MKCRIRFLINTLEAGGAERVLVNLIKNLPPENYQITLVSVTGGVFEADIPPGVCYHCIIRNNGLFSQLLKKLVYHLPPRVFNVLFLPGHYDHEVAYMHGFPTRMMQYKCGTSNTYAFVHGDFAANNSISVQYRNIDECLRAYKSFTKVCFVSENCRDGFYKTIGKIDNALVVHNVINYEDIIEKAKESAPFQFEEKGLRFISVGRLNKVKGYDRLVKIVSILEKEYDFQVVIVGDGEEHPNLQFLIDILKVHSIKLVGFYQNPYCIMKEADCYICASYQEAYSTSVAESVGLGVPVLTTNCAGMSEILGDNQFGLIVENSEDALLEAMRTMLENPQILYDLKLKTKQRSEYLKNCDKMGDYSLLFCHEDERSD